MSNTTLSAIFMALSSAFLLYGLNYDTRQIEARVRAAEHASAKTRSEIAVLKAERAHLARAERIETLARAQGLRPPTEGQFHKLPETQEIVTGSTKRKE